MFDLSENEYLSPSHNFSIAASYVVLLLKFFTLVRVAFLYKCLRFGFIFRRQWSTAIVKENKHISPWWNATADTNFLLGQIVLINLYFLEENADNIRLNCTEISQNYHEWHSLKVREKYRLNHDVITISMHMNIVSVF